MEEAQQMQKPLGNIERKEFLDKMVLLADDEEGVKTALSMYLGMLGCKVETVDNGKELLDKLTANPTKFDFVITDITMPEMDGMEALRAIRADEKLKKIPVVVCSGSLNEAINRKIEELGSSSLEKPFSKALIAASLKEATLKSPK